MQVSKLDESITVDNHIWCPDPFHYKDQQNSQSSGLCLTNFHLKCSPVLIMQS